MPYPGSGETLNPNREILYDLSVYDQFDNRFDAAYSPKRKGAKIDSQLIPSVDLYFPCPTAETVPRETGARNFANPNFCNLVQVWWADAKDTGDVLDPEYPYAWALSKEIPIPSNDVEFRDSTTDVAPLVLGDSPDPTKTQSEKVWQSYTAYRARVVCKKTWDVGGSETDPVLSAESQTAKGEIVAATDWVYPTVGKTTYAYSTINPYETQSTTDEEGADYTPPPQTMKMYLIRSNLPIAQKSIGSSQSPPPFGNVKWRSGFIHTWEGNPADASFPDGVPYGFRFHYNPAGWSQGVQMTESINPDAIMASQPDFLPLYAGFATISVELFLNRIVDLSTARDAYPNGMDTVERRAEKLVADIYQNVGVSSFYGVPGFIADSAINSSVTGKNSANAVSQDKIKLEHAKRILRQGTLYDLDFLYATVNGKALDSYHVRLAGSSNPSYNEDWKPSDYGFLNARYVRIWLGPNITFVGRLTSVQVSHLLFTQYMIPTFSQVTLQIARSATFGSSPEKSKELYNQNVVGTVDPNAEGNDTTGETTAP